MLINIKVLLRPLNELLSIDVRKCTTQALKSSSIPVGHHQQRILNVAVIGMPNSGKSTIINNLMDRKVCPTSSKVHTTRAKCKAIFTEGDAQIIFLDTPGLVKTAEQKKYKLEKSFTKDSKACTNHADIIGVIHDVSNFVTNNYIDVQVRTLLEECKKTPSFLVLNKIDLWKSKRKLLDLTRLLTENSINGINLGGKPSATNGWPYFSKVFMVSALTGDGLLDIKNYLINEARVNKWLFPEDVWSDQSPEDIILNSVKAKFLDFFPQEIPYLLEPYIEFFKEKEDEITTVVLVKCSLPRKLKYISHKGSSTLRKVIETVQQDLQSAFQKLVKINIVVEGLKNKK